MVVASRQHINTKGGWIFFLFFSFFLGDERKDYSICTETTTRERWAVPTHTHTHIDGKGKKDVTAARSGRRLAQSRGNNAITFGSWEKPRPNRVRAALGVCVCIRHTHKGTWLTCFDCLFQKTNIDSRAQHRQTDRRNSWKRGNICPSVCQSLFLSYLRDWSVI